MEKEKKRNKSKMANGERDSNHFRWFFFLESNQLLYTKHNFLSDLQLLLYIIFFLLVSLRLFVFFDFYFLKFQRNKRMKKKTIELKYIKIQKFNDLASSFHFFSPSCSCSYSMACRFFRPFYEFNSVRFHFQHQRIV